MLGLDPSISGREGALTFPRFSGLRFASPGNDGGRQATTTRGGPASTLPMIRADG